MRAYRLLVLLCLSSAACTGFYEIKIKTVDPSASMRSSASQAQNAGASSEPYAVLVGYAKFDALVATRGKIDSSLRLLKLDATLTDSTVDPSIKTTVTVAVYDLQSAIPNEKLSDGLALLKSYPIRTSSNQQLTLDFTSSAVQKNLADQFLQGLAILQDAIPKASVGQGANQVIQSATKILQAFQSPKDGATFTDTMTINLPPGANLRSLLTASPHALILIPTYGSVADVQKRLAAVRTLKLKVCDNDPTTLCVSDDAGEVEYAENPYILLVSDVAYRISDPSFFWKRIAAGSNCAVTDADLAKYVGKVASLEPLLTSDQKAMEEDLLLAARSLSSVRAAGIGKPDVAAALEAMDREWIRSYPTAWLAAFNSDGAPSYNDTRKTIRQCMLTQGAQDFPAYPRLFTLFAKALEAVYSTQASTYADINESLKPLKGFQTTQLPAYKITDPRVTAVVDFAVASIETSLGEFVNGWVKDLDEPTKKAGACKQLVAVVTDSSCDTCRKHATEVLAMKCNVSNTEVLTTVAAATSLRAAAEGTVQLLQDSATPADRDLAGAAAELGPLAAKVASAPSPAAQDLKRLSDNIRSVRALFLQQSNMPRTP